MSDPSAVLRINPQRLTELITTYEHAASELGRILDRVTRHVRLTEAWATDEVSVAMWQHYNAEVFDGPNSTYSALLAYESELSSASRTFRSMLADYERFEKEAAGRFGRLETA